MFAEFGNAPNTTTVAIRGVAQLDFNDHQESPNAVYVDNAYVSFQGATGSGLFDVNHVEVLRGPQGTLFGRNATGGLVHILSNKPTQELSGYLETSCGRYNASQTEGAISGPLSSTLSARL